MVNAEELQEWLNAGECRIISDLRCFIVHRSIFTAIYERCPETYTNRELNKQGYDNFEFRYSTAEKIPYYICTEAVPLLDQLWEKKYKPQQEEVAK